MSQYDINFREYWRILKKRKALVLFITLIFATFFTVFAYLKAPTPIYTTDCLIEFERSPAIEDFYGKFDPSATDEVETQITMVKSYAVFEKIVEKLGMIPQTDIEGNGHLREQVIATIERLRAKVEVEREGGSAILIIKVTDTDPAFAQRLANTIALVYRETHAEQQKRRNAEQLNYIAGQLADVRKKLRNAEDEVNRFTRENELISIDLQSEKLLVKSEDLQNQITKLTEDQDALERLIIRLEGFLEDPFGADRNFYATEADEQFRSANNAMVDLLLKRDTLLKDFTPKHPEVRAISARIIETAKKMLFLIQTQIMGIQKKEADLKEKLDKVTRQIKVLMEKKLEFDRLKRKVQRYDEMTVLLERKNQEALIKNAEKPETVNIVKPALLPTHPINSKNTAAAGILSVVIGVILGFVIAFIVETFDTSLGAIEDVEETLGTKVLGVIPQGDMQQIKEELMKRDPEKFKTYSGKHTVSIISHFFPKSMVAESFRALRTNIQYKDPDKKTRTLAVTSSSPEEGKSMVASNLAIAMAQGGMKTLLVGSDLRKPGIDKAFGVDRAPGLTDILIGEYPWRNTVKTVTDIILGKLSWDEIMLTPGLDNLHIITSGHPPQNPAELIDSRRLEEFIEEVKKEYDIVIFDSSPILSTADAAILGMKVDGVLLVYRVGSISKGLLKRTASQLEQVQCNLLGVIVNGINPDISPDFQGYKYYKYYYSYGEGKNDRVRGVKKQHPKNPFMMSAVIACLAIGFIWQSGLIGSIKRSIGGRPQPHSVSAETEIRKKIIRMDMPISIPKPEQTNDGSRMNDENNGSHSLPTLLSTSARRSGKNTPVVQTTAVQALSEKSPLKAAAVLSALLYGLENNRAIKKPVDHNESQLYPYSIQLGAYRSLLQAKNAVTVYKEKGLSAFWSEVKLDENERWFRVYTGFFSDRSGAQQYRDKQHLPKALVRKTSYGALVGTYSNKNELEKKSRTLHDLDLMPYMIKERDGTYRLFVGAFLTERGAEDQQRILESKGIQSRVVER